MTEAELFSATRPRTRIEGIDAARGLALIGMISAHLQAGPAEDIWGWLYALPHGRASILFVLLAGIGIALLSRRKAERWEARLRLFWFAIVLLPLGLVLQVLNHSVAVILHHYAAFFMLGLCVLGLPKRWLLTLAMALTLVGPLTFLFGRMAGIGVFRRDVVSVLDPPGEVISGLLVSGGYPLITWAAPLVWGIWLGRQNLRDPRLWIILCAIGAMIAVSASGLSEVLTETFGDPRSRRDWRLALIDVPHSQMPLWMIGGIGSAMFILGASLFAADRLPRLMLPSVALGQFALTLYVGHLMALTWWSQLLRPGGVLPSVIVLVVLATIGVVFALAWRKVLPRGPVELALHGPWEFLKATTSGRHDPKDEATTRGDPNGEAAPQRG